MADLDDFFAKKDKRTKNKKKGPVKPMETLEKKLEDVNRNNQEQRSRKVHEDDEWNDYEQEKDYSGLKIQALSLEEEEAQREAQEASKKAAEQAQEVVWTGEKSDKPAPKPVAKPADDDEPEFMAAFRRKNQVRIHDVIEFPSLGTPSEAYDEIQGFQAVRSGATNLDNNQAARDNIKTANKFSALQ